MPELDFVHMEQCRSLSQTTASVGGYEQTGLGSERSWPSCPCPSYKFSRATIEFGLGLVKPLCKHIVYHQEHICGWHQQWSEERLETPGICPRCGDPTDVVLVGV